MPRSSILPVTGLFLAVLLAGCEEPVMRGEPYIPGPGGAPASEKLKSERILSWQPAQRLAWIGGHLAAASSVLEAGAEVEKAGVLIDAAAEVYVTQPDALTALGFQPQKMLAARDAVTAGRPAEEVAALAGGAGAEVTALLGEGETGRAALIDFLIRASAEAYDKGVRYGSIESLADYQAAYGHARMARDLAGGVGEEGLSDLRLELELLLLMWPAAGPVEAATPPPEFRMAEQYSRVKLRLASLP